MGLVTRLRDDDEDGVCNAVDNCAWNATASIRDGAACVFDAEPTPTTPRMNSKRPKKCFMRTVLFRGTGALGSVRRSRVFPNWHITLHE